MVKVGIGATALALLMASGVARAEDTIKVGVTATLEGTYTILGVDGIAGFNAAVKKYGDMAGGKKLEFVIASTDATPDSAVRAVQEADRAGQGADPPLAAVRRRRHRGQELLAAPIPN